MITTGLAGLFMVRGFIPAFVIAVVLRFGPEYGLNAEVASQLQEAAGSVGQAPSWFTSNPALIVLGILAALEVGAPKDPDLRALLSTVESYIKPTMAGLTYFGVLNATDAGYLESTYMEAGFFSVLFAAGLIMATWIGSIIKGSFVSMITDLDPDDSLGLMRAVSFLGDAWVIVGAALVVLIPVLVAGLVLISFAVIAVFRKRAKKRDEASKRPCASCGELVYRCATNCQRCHGEQADVCDVNWIGGAIDRPAHPRDHRFRLVAIGRCPKCATRWKRKDAAIGCPVCHAHPFADESFISEYDGFIRRRVPMTLVVCGLFGLIPILGFAIGIVVSKIRLDGPYRRYIGRGVSMAARWMLRIVLLIAIFVQLIPGPNALVVAGMALVSFVVYRGLFNRRAYKIASGVSAGTAEMGSIAGNDPVVDSAPE